MRSLRSDRRRPRSKSELLTQGGIDPYYVTPADLSELANIIAATSSGQMEKLLRTLFTKKELVNLTRRIAIAKMILAGMSYEQISIKLHASKSTIQLVNQILHGQEGLVENTISQHSKISRRTKTDKNYDPVTAYIQQRLRKGK